MGLLSHRFQLAQLFIVVNERLGESTESGNPSLDCLLVVVHSAACHCPSQQSPCHCVIGHVKEDGKHGLSHLVTKSKNTTLIKHNNKFLVLMETKCILMHVSVFLVKKVTIPGYC